MITLSNELDVLTLGDENAMTFITESKNYIGLKNNDINTIKLTELPIADRHSTGGQISKHALVDAYLVASLKKKNSKQDKIIDDVESEPIEEEKTIPMKEKISLKEIDDRLMTIDDFLN